MFLAVLFGALWRANDILRLKGFSAGYSMEVYYQQEPGTVDVLLLGNSHMFANVNPAVLWDEYGMAAYAVGAGLQPLWNTYYYLDEALKYQTPELIVIDVSNSVQEFEYQSSDRVAMNTFGLRISENLMESVEASVEYESQYMDYKLKYPVYHTRYAELAENDFRLDYGDVNYDNFKGYGLVCISTTPCGLTMDIGAVTEVTPMMEKNEKYLRMIIERVQEAGIPLQLTINPYSGVQYKEKEVYNYVEQIAAEYGVEFVDFNEHYTEIGFDSLTDFSESQHLNYYGAEKFSSYIGMYLKKNFEISDHRGQDGYESWEANSDFYAKHAANVDLTKTVDEAAYMQKLFADKERYTICLSNRLYSEVEDNVYLKALRAQGLDVENETTWIIHNGEVVYREGGYGGIPDYNMDLGDCTVAVLNGYLYQDGEEIDVVGEGLNVFVYDNELQEIVDTCGIEAWQEETAVVTRENQL